MSSSTARTIHAYAAEAPKQPVRPYDFEAPELGPNDVEIKVVTCGICHSDVSLLDGEWGPFSVFPGQVCGHEAVGRVTALGSAVTHLKEGQLVGYGWYKDACQHCEWCLNDDHQMCDKNEPTCAAGNRGGFADYFRGNASFAFPIPEGLAPEHASPLLCGGITVYTPIRDYAKPGSRVGIVGIGGLGHMAVKFAAASGCEVTAISSSASKKEMALEMGAHHFVNGGDEDELKAAADSLDLLLVTANVKLDWSKYLNMLRRHGTLCFVGAVLEPMELPIFGDLIMKSLKVAGSVTGGRGRITEMLNFAAVHKVFPTVEVMPFSEINTALDKVRNNEARFRMVLKHDE